MPQNDMLALAYWAVWPGGDRAVRRPARTSLSYLARVGVIGGGNGTKVRLGRRSEGPVDLRLPQ